VRFQQYQNKNPNSVQALLTRYLFAWLYIIRGKHYKALADIESVFNSLTADENMKFECGVAFVGCFFKLNTEDRDIERLSRVFNFFIGALIQRYGQYSIEKNRYAAFFASIYLNNGYPDLALPLCEDIFTLGSESIYSYKSTSVDEST